MLNTKDTSMQLRFVQRRFSYHLWNDMLGEYSTTYSPIQRHLQYRESPDNEWVDVPTEAAIEEREYHTNE